MSTKRKPVSFGHTLRKTTREPLFLPPPFWNHNHLKLLRVCIVDSKSQLDDQLQEAQEVPSKPSSATKNLPNGHINEKSVNNYWYWARTRCDSLVSEAYLPRIITKLVHSVQKNVRAQYFATEFKAFTTAPPELAFAFAGFACILQPEYLVRTSGTKLPFFVFSGLGHKIATRNELSEQMGGQGSKILRDVGLAKFDLDPFDVACLIAMAQEQAYRIKKSQFPEIPKHFTTYLMTPHPETLGLLYLFTVKVPQNYLDAMCDINVKVNEDLVITREIIELPLEYDLSKEMDKGVLAQRFGEILEEAYVYHHAIKGLKDERDAYDRKAAKIQSLEAEREMRALGFGRLRLLWNGIRLPTGPQGLARPRNDEQNCNLV